MAGQVGASTVRQPKLKHCNAVRETVVEGLEGRPSFAEGDCVVAHPPTSAASRIQRNKTGVFIV
jgi:hypothetical protein